MERAWRLARHHTQSRMDFALGSLREYCIKAQQRSGSQDDSAAAGACQLHHRHVLDQRRSAHGDDDTSRLGRRLHDIDERAARRALDWSLRNGAQVRAHRAHRPGG